MSWKDIKEYIPIAVAAIFGGGGVFAWLRYRDKDKAEVKSLEAETGQSYGNQAKAFADAAKTLIEAKSIIEGQWERYAAALSKQIEDLKKEHSENILVLERAMAFERQEYEQTIHYLEKQIENLSKK